LVLGRLEVLTVNATVIIGLLVLLTFQSISSSFIENESSAFMLKWNEAQNRYFTVYGLLEDCKLLNEDIESYEELFLEIFTIIDIDGSLNQIFDHLPEETKDEIKRNCVKLPVEGLEAERNLLELDDWGYRFSYLEQYDPENDIVRTIKEYDFDPGLETFESDYFRNIATGPLWVNLTNLVMLFPFLVSAMITSFNMVRKKDESERASRAAILSMAIGFVMMIVGLIIIVGGFVVIYEPFIQ